jgi:hypothetical protein
VTAPRESDFDGYETDKGVLLIMATALAVAPEQGDWPWDEHCEGVALSVLEVLHRCGYHVHKDATGVAAVGEVTQ